MPVRKCFGKRIECTVNGEMRQSSNTSDIIYTGTPEGVLNGYPKDKQVWLKPGDKLTTKIEKLGEMRFGVV